MKHKYMMKKIKKISMLMIGLGFTAQSVSAAYFSSFIYEMSSDESFIAKPVRNDTKTSNMYEVKSFKIDKPGVKGENRVQEESRDLVYTPAKLKIDSNSTDFFKILYIGPKDDKERYYRVVFKETPLTTLAVQDQKNATSFFPTVSMSTILVVRPRKQIFKYEVDEIQGIIRNTGNTFFRVIIQKGCNGTDEDANHFYMLPGEVFQNNSVKGNNRKFIVANKKYVPIGNQCFQKNA
jgi:Mat/Ecp fimbriae periplasmic chaperone